MIKLIKKIISLFSKSNECYFIGSTDILPPPLDKNTEYELSVKSYNGDIEARNIIIEHNLRLVVFLAKKYESSGYDLEDLVSIGSVGLIKGVNTYKPNHSIKVATYVSRCICNEILMFIRKNKKQKCEVSLEETLNFDAEGNTLNLEDVIGTDEDIIANQYEDKVNKKYLSDYLSKLSNREKLIMTLRYGLNNTEEYTQKEVAQMLGISQSYISRIEKKIINNVKLSL